LVKPAEPDPTDPTDPADPTDPDDPELPAEPAPPSGQLDPAILTALHGEILALEAVRDSLDVSSLPAPLFEPELTNLDAWYADALTAAINAALTTSEVNSLDIHEWTGARSDTVALFVDNSDELRTGITGLISQAAEATGRLTDLSMTVPDNASLFDALFRNSTSTATGAEKAFTGVNDLLNSGNSGLAQNQAYYANFATVLANTRTPGVDTGIIYSFFSAPIDAKNVTPDRAASASASNPLGVLDPNLLIVFAGGLLAGAVATTLGGVLRRKRA
jgi:hypothetical protein